MGGKLDGMIAPDERVNHDGSRVWKRVLRAIKVLTEERAGETLH